MKTSVVFIDVTVTLMHVPVDRYTTFYEVKGLQKKSEKRKKQSAEAANQSAEGRETPRLDF